MSEPLLVPVVIAIMPRWSDAVGTVSELRVDHALALAESEEQAKRFRLHWAHRHDSALLLLPCSPANAVSLAVEAVLEIASRHPQRPIVILLGDGPESQGFREEKRANWNRDFAKEISIARVDVQIHQYSPSWATSPPRIR